MEELVEIGRLKKAHGLKGELRIQVQEHYLEDLFDAEVLFLDLNGQQIPFFIEAFREEAVPPIVKLEDIDSKEAAERLQGKTILLRKSDLQDPDIPEAALSGLEFLYLKGFMVLDPEGQEVGLIAEVEAYPQQEMAVVQGATNEYLIPIHKDMILHIDVDAKTLQLDLPDGLLDLF